MIDWREKKMPETKIRWREKKMAFHEMKRERIGILLDDREYVVVDTYYPVKSKRMARKDEAYLEAELPMLGSVYRISGHLVAARHEKGIEIYEF